MLSIEPLIHEACNNYLQRVKSAIRQTFGDTGTLANSIQYQIRSEGKGYIINIEFNIYGIILHYAAKKGSYKRRRFQSDSPLITQDEKYKIIIRELQPLERELAEIISKEVGNEATKIILNAFTNLK